MSKEWLSYAELPMKELVHEYLQVPLGEPVDWPLFTESLETQLKLEDEISKDVIGLVQDGYLPPAMAEMAIANAYSSFENELPQYQVPLNYIRLYLQSKVWIGHSLFLSKFEKEVDFGELQKAQEKAARLLMQAEIVAGTRLPHLAKCIFGCLINIGFQKEALAVVESSFSGIFITKSQEETQRLVRAVGEKDPVNIRSGIATVSKSKVEKARHN